MDVEAGGVPLEEVEGGPLCDTVDEGVSVAVGVRLAVLV
jgi:hypothetical protein